MFWDGKTYPSQDPYALELSAIFETHIYSFGSNELRKQARRAYRCMQLAKQTGCSDQEARYKLLAAELYGKDLAHTRIAPAAERLLAHLNSADGFVPHVMTESMIAGIPTVWRTPKMIWRTAEIEDFGDLIPEHALEALQLVRRAHFPFCDFHIAKCEPVVKQPIVDYIFGELLDPVLIGRVAHTKIGVGLARWD